MGQSLGNKGQLDESDKEVWRGMKMIARATKVIWAQL